MLAGKTHSNIFSVGQTPARPFSEDLASIPHSKSAPDLSAFCTVQANKWRRHSFDNDSESNGDAKSSDGKLSTDGSSDDVSSPDHSANTLQRSLLHSYNDSTACPSSTETSSWQDDQHIDRSSIAVGTNGWDVRGSPVLAQPNLRNPRNRISNGMQPPLPQPPTGAWVSERPPAVWKHRVACLQAPSMLSISGESGLASPASPLNSTGMSSKNVQSAKLHDPGTLESGKLSKLKHLNSPKNVESGRGLATVSSLHSDLGLPEVPGMPLTTTHAVNNPQTTETTILSQRGAAASFRHPRSTQGNSLLATSSPSLAGLVHAPSGTERLSPPGRQDGDVSRRKLMLRLGLAPSDRTMGIRPLCVAHDGALRSTNSALSASGPRINTQTGQQPFPPRSFQLADFQPPKEGQASRLVVESEPTGRNSREDGSSDHASSVTPTTFGSPARLSCRHQSISNDATSSVASADHDATTAGKFRLSSIHLRSREDFRVNYLRKLSYANVWIPQAQRPPRHQTISIFDWDDTLLCTSYINLRGSQFGTAAISKQLAAIEQHAKLLLATALKLGRVFVITNAMDGWVEYSVKQYLPGLLRTMQHVTVISARHRYECSYPGDYQRWKVQAFLEVRRSLNSEVITNLLSLGDSTIEMDAVHVMGQEFSQALIKTIKFRENPSPDELAKQLELVSQKFEKICLSARNLKIGLERRVMQPKQRRHDRPNGGESGRVGQRTCQSQQAKLSSSAMEFVDEAKLGNS